VTQYKVVRTSNPAIHRQSSLGVIIFEIVCVQDEAYRPALREWIAFVRLWWWSDVSRSCLCGVCVCWLINLMFSEPRITHLVHHPSICLNASTLGDKISPHPLQQCLFPSSNSMLFFYLGIIYLMILFLQFYTCYLFRFPGEPEDL